MHDNSFSGACGLAARMRAWVIRQSHPRLGPMIGTDAWTLDRPFDAMIADFKGTGDASCLVRVRSAWGM